MRRSRFATLALGLPLVLKSLVTAAAPNADICYGPHEDMALCSTTQCPLPTSETVFSCPVAGQKTLSQLAQDGWVVIQIVQRTYSLIAGTNIQVEQLIIQHP